MGLYGGLLGIDISVDENPIESANVLQIVSDLQQVIADFDRRPTYTVRGKGGQTFAFFATSVTDNIPPLQPRLSRAISSLSRLHLTQTHQATLGVGEEDRGAMIISDILLSYDLPRTLARWTPSGAPGEIGIPLANEYIPEGSIQVFLNGVKPEDRVILVDDLISTGGTMVALIQAVQKAGAEILEIFTIGEKTENRGREYVWQQTGYHVKTLLASGLVEKEDGQVVSTVTHCYLGNLLPTQFVEVAAHFPAGFCRPGSGEMS
ncbi:MAG: phosphoribosyltransferase family protein [Cyanobacteriota bacterium]|nr:phosphoribosyltransferase family protein [Cyanobacteriota bacterium]